MAPKKREDVYKPRYGKLDSRGRLSRRREGKTDSWHPDSMSDSDALDSDGDVALNSDEQRLIDNIRRHS